MESESESENKSTLRRSKRLEDRKRKSKNIVKNPKKKSKKVIHLEPVPPPPLEPISYLNSEEKKDESPTVLPRELFFFILPSPETPKEKRPKKEEEEQDEQQEEKEHGQKEETPKDSFGPFFPIVRNIQTIKFTKIFETLDELISLGEKYDPGISYICNIDMKKLHNIVEPMKELNNMIGLNKFKKNIIDQLVYILTTDFTNSSEIPMLHSCIYGSPGTGKTSVCEILGKIYSKCGILSKGGIKIAKREDFVGEFLGSSSIKTKKLLESCKGKVLFIDEVYSFGSSKSNSKDMFAKEAVDCLNAFLSENYKDFICIIAGYKDEVEKCFFSINEGLKRRFTNTYTIDSYSFQEMSQIFLKFVKDEDWSIDIDTKKMDDFFSEHKDSFPYYGGDIKTLLDKCKIVHSRRIVMLEKNLWKVLNEKDIEEGFLSYLEDRQVKKEEDSYIKTMYM